MTLPELLTDRQALFAGMVGELLTHVDRNLEGYRVRLSWAYRDAASNELIGGHPKSTHMARLAIDLVLDRYEEGRWVYQRDTSAYEPLGLYWESLGGSWGGRFNDGGHFSLPWRGIK